MFQHHFDCCIFFPILSIARPIFFNSIIIFTDSLIHQHRHTNCSYTLKINNKLKSGKKLTFVQENTQASVFSLQGLLYLLSEYPPHKSTTNRPLWNTAIAAPSSSQPSSKFRLIWKIHRFHYDEVHKLECLLNGFVFRVAVSVNLGISFRSTISLN